MFTSQQHDPPAAKRRHWFAWAYGRGVLALAFVVTVSYLFALQVAEWSIPELIHHSQGDFSVEAAASAIWNVEVEAPHYQSLAEYAVTRLSDPFLASFLVGGAIVALLCRWQVRRSRR